MPESSSAPRPAAIIAVSVFHPLPGEDFAHWAAMLAASATDSEGCLGAEISTVARGHFEPAVSASFVDEENETSLSVLRFRTDRQLSAWVYSRERSEALAGLRANLTHDFVPMTSTTAFGTTVRTDGVRILKTPNWKSAMMVLLVLYPTVMTLSRFLGPTLDRLGAQPWLALWLSQVVSVSLMQWWLMPWASRPFRRWLDPVDGRGRRSNAAGACAVVLIYLASLALFANVTWLQFWDYADG